MLKRTSSRSEDGVSVAEVVVAAAILMAGFVACVQATSAAIGAQGRAADRDRSLAAAYDIADRLHDHRCLLATGSDIELDFERLADRCRSALRIGPVLGVGEGMLAAGITNYPFSYASRWPGAASPEPGSACASSSYARPAIGVERTIDVIYRERADRRSRIRVTRFDAAPADAYQLWSSQRSALVVATGDAGATAELMGPSGQTVRRAADPNGCVWFPALRTASLQLRATSGSGGSRAAAIDFVADPRATSPRVVNL